MTTANSSSGPGNTSNNKPEGGSKPTKKAKSAGFIETTGFKPNWLETGPLSPEMLIAPPVDTAPQTEPAIENETVDETHSAEPADETVQMEQYIASAYPGIGPDELTDQLSPEDLEAIEKLLEKYGDREITVDDEPIALSNLEPEESLESESVTQENDSSEEELDLASVAALLAAEASTEEAVLAPLLKTIESLPADANITAPEVSSRTSPTAVEPVTASSLAGAGASPATAPRPSPTTSSKSASQREASARGQAEKKKRDRLSWVLFLLGLALLAAAAIIYFVNPFTRLALSSASLARPVTAAGVVAPADVGGDWCVRGDFLDQNAGPLQLVDTGSQGDILSQDFVHSLEYPIAQAGTYQWQVINCADPAIAYPPQPAWLRTENAGQAVTFIFDSNEREDPLFFPIPYVVTALDSTSGYQAIGSFQDWDPADSTSSLDRIYSGLYQQIRQIALPGTYEGYIIDEVSQQAVDAYGRATEPIPFSFETTRPGEFVVFLLDTDRGRASVLHDMSPLYSNLAFGQGNLLISVGLAVLGAILLLGLLLRQWVLRNRRFWLEAGCPSCGEQELMRIARRDSDRYLNVVGIPAYRYRCRHCTWEGLRLSEEGAPVSPGVTITTADIFK